MNYRGTLGCFSALLLAVGIKYDFHCRLCLNRFPRLLLPTTFLSSLIEPFSPALLLPTTFLSSLIEPFSPVPSLLRLKCHRCTLQQWAFFEICRLCSNIYKCVAFFSGILLGYTIGSALPWHYLACFMVGPSVLLVIGESNTKTDQLQIILKLTVCNIIFNYPCL